jgi:hypothetical protein
VQQALEWRCAELFRRIKLRMRSPDVRLVALVNQVFFGRHIVVETGFGQAKTTGNIG